VINIVAGVGIGVGMRGMGAVESLRLYGLLTIGDGLVCQIPSLLISTAAGLVVTRVASAQHGESLGGDVGRQLFGEPRLLAMAAGFLALLALVPGLPALPFAFCALLLAAASYGVMRVRASARSPQLNEDVAIGGEAALVLQLGEELASAVASGEALPSAVRATRDQLFTELGLRFGALPVRVSAALPARGFAFELHDVPLVRGVLAPGRDATQLAGELAGQLHALARRRASELFGLEQAQRWLDELERGAPALVRAAVPKPVTLTVLGEVLRRLLAEGVSIRPRERILEALVAVAAEPSFDSAPRAANIDTAALTERVRARLQRQITHAASHDGVLALHAIDPLIEDALRDAASAGGGALALPPDQARDIVAAVRALAQQSPARPTVLVSQADVRRHLRKLLEVELPEVRVLSYAEVAPEAAVEQRERVRIGG
jgi:type III secretion protein V